MSIFKSAFEKFSAENANKMTDSLVSLGAKTDQLIMYATASLERLNEIARDSSEQVKHLKDIKRILVKGSTARDKADSVKGTSKKESGDTSIFRDSGDKVKGVVANIKEAAIGLALMAGALILFIPALALAGILISPKMIPGILAVTVAMALMSVAFAKLVQVMAENKVKREDILNAAMALAIMAPVIVLTALIFLLLPDQYKFPDPLWSLGAAFSILLFSVSMALLMKAGGRVLGKNKSLVWQLPLLVIGLATSIVLAAWIMQLLPDTYKYPDPMWSLNVGFAILMFAIPAIILSLMKWTVKEIFLLPLLITALAASMLAAAWLTSFMPDEWKYPPMAWSIGLAVGILIIGAAAALLGKLVQLTGGPVGFLIGVLAMIVVALAIVALAWIFQLLPSAMFEPGGLLYKMADAMEYWGKKMVDVFLYLVEGALPYIEHFIEFLARLFVELFPKIVEPLSRFIDALAQSFGRLLDHVVPLITAAFNGIATVLQAASNIIVPIINAIKDVILGVLDFIIQGFQEFRGFINDLASIGAGNIAAIGVSLFSLAGGLAAVMAVLAGGAAASGVGNAVGALGNMAADAFNAIGGLFGGEKSEEPKMDPMQFISFVAENVGALQGAATALESIAKSMAAIVTLRPSDGIMKFMDKMSYYAKVMGGGFFGMGGPADAIVKVNRSFGKFFEDLGKVDSMKLIKMNDIITAAYNLAKLDKASEIEDVMEALGDFIAQAVETMAANADEVKGLANKTEIANTDIKAMIEQLKAAVAAMSSQNLGSQVSNALKNADLSVTVKNMPTKFP